MSDRVILVDEHDRPTGTAEKISAHRAGRLHRAFSVFVINDAGEILLQRRAGGKYHSAGLWSNTCCSHPRPGEPTTAAAHRRLREEMGFDCPLEPAGVLLYRADLDGLVEHEYDHLLVGRWTGTPDPEPAEVSDWRWVAPADLYGEIARHPERFTAWFRPALRRLHEGGALPDAPEPPDARGAPPLRAKRPPT